LGIKPVTMAKKKQKTTRRRKKTKVASERKVNAKQAKKRPPRKVPEPEQASSKSDVNEPNQAESSSTEAQAKEQPPQTAPEPEQASSKSGVDGPGQAEPSSAEAQAKEQPPRKVPEPEQASSKSDVNEPNQAESSSTEAQAKEQPPQTAPEPEQASSKSDVNEPNQAESSSAEAQAKEQPPQTAPEPEQASSKSGVDEPGQAEPSSAEAQAKEQPPQTVPEPEQASSKSDVNEPGKAEPCSTEAHDKNQNQRGSICSIETQQVDNKENIPMRCAQIQRKRLSKIQKILIFCIILVEVILLYVVFRSRPEPNRNKRTTSADMAVLAPKQVHAATPPNSQKTGEPSYSDSGQPVDDSIEEVQPLSQITTPVISSAETSSFSLIAAETFYMQKDFKQAYANFEQLYRNLPVDPREDPLRDFLRFKMAFCLKKTGDFEQSNRLFQALSQSRFPVIRIAVNYNQCIDLVQMKQYLTALTKAYQTIALIDAVDWTLLDETNNGLYSDWASRFAKDCQFLAAECLTKEILSLCDADKDLPSELWSHSLEFDPFVNLPEVKLRRLLSSGSGKLSKALLAPLIQSVGGRQNQGLMPRWDVSCCGASFEELLARFVANTDVDIDWACEPSEGLRNRPVNLYMSAATIQQFITVAAGCAGLLAQFDDRKIVNIFNPFNYTSLSEHIDLLSKQAISLWQIYLLTFRDDERISNAHFLIGLLQAQQGNLNDAITEYKFTANRYSRTSFAPFALLNSSKLKTKLRDYSGARDDLKQLVQQYPNSEIYDCACMYLADVTMETGLLQEATKLYRKVYNLGLSLESQRASVLGAGKCFYLEKDYENATKWLTRYVNLAEDRTNRDFCSACFLLGKANMALRRYEQASQVFQYALAGQLPTHEYLEAVSAFVKTHVQQGRLLEALELLENTRSRQLSQDDSIEISLLKAGVLRSMGMFDEAIAVLGEASQYLPNSQLKAKVFLERAKCLIAKGNLESASRSLIETLVFVTPGPLACEVRYELADICLKLGEDTQVVSICSQLLASEPEAALKQKTLELLATAYTRLKEYDKATLALLGQWTPDEKTKVKGDSGGPNREGITTKGPVIQDTQHDEG